MPQLDSALVLSAFILLRKGPPVLGYRGTMIWTLYHEGMKDTVTVKRKKIQFYKVRSVVGCPPTVRAVQMLPGALS